MGVLWASPAGSGAEPHPKSNLVHYSLKIWDLVATILIIFLRINCPNLSTAISNNPFSPWTSYFFPLKISSDLRELHKCPWRSGGSHSSICSILATPLCVSLCVSLCMCLCAKYLKKLWTDFDETLWRGAARPREKLRFWWICAFFRGSWLFTN